jgi:hypothetical protein
VSTIQPDVTKPNEAVVDTLITGAWTQLSLVVQGADSHNNRGFATLAANLAVIALVFARETVWTWWWVLPLTAGAATTFSLWNEVRHRPAYLGPDIEAFYNIYGAASSIEAKLALLGKLSDDIYRNQRVVPAKANWQTWAERFLIVELVSGLLILGFISAGLLR